MNNILSELGIDKINYGACSGKDNWSNSDSGGLLKSINPSDKKEIASVYQSNEDDYNNVVSDSIKAFKDFRKVPAPIRGQLVRQMADTLRANKDSLGTLVSMEMGKINKEGDG